MTSKNIIVSIILGGHYCGNGYTADDLAMLSRVFSMAAKTVRAGGHGRLCCSEPGADSQGKLLAEIRIEDPDWTGRCQKVTTISRVDISPRSPSFTTEDPLPEIGPTVSE